MPIVIPTFNFHGQCEEAINLYKKAFNAKVDCMFRYSDADKRDWDTPLPAEQANYIYHAEMHIADQRIMLSDIIEFELVKSTSLFLNVVFDTADEVKKAYEVLKEGSTIVYPMKSTTYSSCFVSIIDRFGIRWVLMTEQTER